MPEKMTGGSFVERSFKNKGTVRRLAALPLAPILLVQKSVGVGEAAVEGVTVAVGTYKESLNQSWRYSDKTLRCSSQYSASTEMKHSNEILAEF